MIRKLRFPTTVMAWSAILLCSLFAQPETASPATTIPAGSLVRAILLKPIDAKKNKDGDEVTAKVTRDLKVGDAVVIAKGTKLIGQLSNIKAKPNGDEPSTVTIVFDHAMQKDGTQMPLVVAIKALAKPVENAPEVSDLLRGTGAQASAADMQRQMPSAGIGGGPQGGEFGDQSEGVWGYTGLGFQDPIVFSPVRNVHLDGGTRLILRVSGK